MWSHPAPESRKNVADGHEKCARSLALDAQSCHTDKDGAWTRIDMTEHSDSTAEQRGERDASLVRAHLAGDRTALAAVYDLYGQSLYDTAAAMTNSRDDAADMVQDVFVLAAERLGQLRDQTRLKPWLFAILRNEVYRRSRRRARTISTDFSSPERDVVLPPTPSATDAVDDEIDYTEIAELVRGAARGLDARDQLVLELSVRQGLSGADLADALGVSAQQSYGLVHRMRERTERSLGAYCVARKGRRECQTLDDILKGWDGDFSVLLRKRVSRHIEECSICERTKRRFAPIALVGAAPAFAAPVELRDRIIERLDALHPQHGNGSTFSSSNGFPVLEGAARVSRRLVAIVGTAAAAIVIIGSLWVGRSSDGADLALPPPTGATVSVADGGTAPPLIVADTSTSTLPATTTTATASSAAPSTSVTATTLPANTTALPVVVTSTTRPTVTTTPGAVSPAVSLPGSTTTTTTTATTTTTSTSTTTTTTTTTTTLAPAPPVIVNAASGTGDIALPSECDTDVWLTLTLDDPNGDLMTAELSWSVAPYGEPNVGSSTVTGLANGEHRLLLATLDYTHRMSTLSVMVTVTDTNGQQANWGRQIATTSGGTCPSTFG